MARLSKHEKRQLVAATKRRSAKARNAAPPGPGLLTPRDYIEFATFAARFGDTTKPVRFVGDDWKL